MKNKGHECLILKNLRVLPVPKWKKWWVKGIENNQINSILDKNTKSSP